MSTGPREVIIKIQCLPEGFESDGVAVELQAQVKKVDGVTDGDVFFLNTDGIVPPVQQVVQI